MFRFIIPFQDLSVWDVAIGATDLDAAVDQYLRLYWNPCTVGAIAVFHNHALVGRIIPKSTPETEDNVPLFQEWPG